MRTSIPHRGVASLVAACLAPALGARADVVNGGFELPVLAPGEFRLYNTGDTINGWTVVGVAGGIGVVGLMQRTYAEPANGMSSFPSAQGLNCIDLSGAANSGLASGVQQTVSTVPGREYSVQFWVGRAAGGAVYSTPATLDLSIGGGPRTSFTNAGAFPASVSWRYCEQRFVAVGTSTTITFYNGQTSNYFTGLDQVTVTPYCYPDCDHVGGLVGGEDFQCFLDAYVAGQSYADCDGVGGLTANDFFCFLNKFVAGCS